MLAKIAWGNVRKSLSDFGVYFVTVMLGVAVFYAFNSMTAQQGVLTLTEQQSAMLELLGMIIGGVSVFIACVLVFLVVYANGFLICRRKREFGMYLLLGMGAGSVARIVLLESLIVGVASLICGLGLGVGLSQVLLLVTSLLFQAPVAADHGLAFVFSTRAFVQAICVFGVIFALAALLNVCSVSRTKLIDLMQADRRVQVAKVRSIPVSLTLFALSLVLIGAAYKLLLDNGLMDISPQFVASVMLVCAGTVLFFFSLSGFLVRASKLFPQLYLRGLNMFTAQQLASRVNTAFASLAVVCMVLFLALTSVCGGLGIRNATEASLVKGTSYSMSVSSYVGGVMAAEGEEGKLTPYAEYAASVGYDMLRGLEESLRRIGRPDAADKLSSAHVTQIDFYLDEENPATYGDVEQAAGFKLTDKVQNREINDTYSQMSLYMVKLSQLNAALELAGKQPVSLEAGECLVLFDMDFMAPFWDAAAQSHALVNVGGKELKLAGTLETCVVTTPIPTNSGAVVVADADMPQTAVPFQSSLDVQLGHETDADALREAVAKVQLSEDPDTWPVDMCITRTDCYDQSVGISTVVGYLAIYLGFVLIIACAAILSIQQLSEASDNARRYGLLRKLGAPAGMINRALFVQVLVYFLFPLLLAVAHSVCAMRVVADVVAVFGHFEIGSTAAFVAACFLVVYGAYFVITYLCARKCTRG